MRVFRDIVVMPTQALPKGEGGGYRPAGDGIFRGGPVWPLFPLQVGARHCRGLVPIPCDRRPRAMPQAARRVEAGVWCGPVSPHFGHMIADFGMRIAQAAHRTDLPLVFSIGPDRQAEPPDFFRDILRHLRVPESRVMLIREPTLFGSLAAPRQAERIGGPGPSREHLDLMDAIVGRAEKIPQDIGVLFVSRSRFPDGRLAAEAYLDAALTRAGATIVHPETIDLAAQLDLYRRARRIVFSEGSALHGLQLLGRLDAQIVVLVRRTGLRLAERMMRPRVRSLAYWDLTTHLIASSDTRGRRQVGRALSLFDAAGLLARFRGIGIDLAPHWDAATYRAWREADLRRWIAYMRHWNLHPNARATIGRSLAAARIGIDVDEAWMADAGLVLGRDLAPAG